MKFLDVFNEIEKGNYALTDEAIYSSIQNNDELIPLYGGNKNHRSTNRKISVSAKTKKGIPITVFSGEGIIISLDGSAGSMTYKFGEKFALNHHAGFITLRDDAKSKVNLEFFSIYLQNFYRGLSISDGSKTLSLTQLYSEEFNLPSYEIQCEVLQSIKNTSTQINVLENIKAKILELLNKELVIEYMQYQAKKVPISHCIGYISGNSGLTEEFIYQKLHNKHNKGTHYKVLSSAAESNDSLGEISFCQINGKDLKIFQDKEGLLVNRKGKAGLTRFLSPGKYTLNDDAYILYVKENTNYNIDLKWLAYQHKRLFMSFASSADNGTWNMTVFFKYATLDIPDINEQQHFVKLIENAQRRILAIDNILNKYNTLLSKEITS